MLKSQQQVKEKNYLWLFEQSGLRSATLLHIIISIVYYYYEHRSLNSSRSANNAR